jgi:hypothetical protein
MANGRNGQMHYNVTMFHDWKLLGMKVYTSVVLMVKAKRPFSRRFHF